MTNTAAPEQRFDQLAVRVLPDRSTLGAVAGLAPRVDRTAVQVPLYWSRISLLTSRANGCMLTVAGRSGSACPCPQGTRAWSGRHTQRPGGRCTHALWNLPTHCGTCPSSAIGAFHSPWAHSTARGLIPQPVGAFHRPWSMSGAVCAPVSGRCPDVAAQASRVGADGLEPSTPCL